MIDVFVTFGQIHAHKINGITFDCDSIMKMKATDELTARQWLVRELDNRYMTTYLSVDADLLKFFPRGIIDSKVEAV